MKINLNISTFFAQNILPLRSISVTNEMSHECKPALLVWKVLNVEYKGMTMKKIKYFIAAAAIISISNAQADNREFADIYTECGLGAMIAPNNEAVAAVTNVTWDLGTTAISSNISSPDTCQGGKAKTAAYIHNTYAQLEADLAKGEGEHLAALLEITGCDSNKHNKIVYGLRADFTKTVSSQGYESQTRFQKAGALHNQLSQRVTSTCTI